MGSSASDLAATTIGSVPRVVIGGEKKVIGNRAEKEVVLLLELTFYPPTVEKETKIDRKSFLERFAYMFSRPLSKEHSYWLRPDNDYILETFENRLEKIRSLMR